MWAFKCLCMLDADADSQLPSEAWKLMLQSLGAKLEPEGCRGHQ